MEVRATTEDAKPPGNVWGVVRAREARMDAGWGAARQITPAMDAERKAITQMTQSAD